ncbi:MAG: Rha family transcriptional regulator [Desulfosporosinus sp.]|nr:Rha family transcriptional regulator [Desulfosporosinus sp.]
MNNVIIKHAIDSREVSEMVDRPHYDLMKSIRQYCGYLGEGNFSCSDFFIETSYLSEQNKKMPCYLLTKKGCELVANKMTGRKGVLFTAAYVTRFAEMEKAMKDPKTLREEALHMNARTRQAKMLFNIAKTFKKQLSTEEIQLLISNAIEYVTGQQPISKFHPQLGGK